MSVVTVITYILIVIAAISAVAVLFVKEVFHAALLLLICLLCVAGIFVTFNAEFLAVVQLIVYAGGVLLIIVFGIMLTVRSKESHMQNDSRNEIMSGVVGLILFAMLVYAIDGTSHEPGTITALSPENIGFLLMTDYALPFETAGMLLLICLVGAIVAATSKEG
jgi:NADH:ubiquinone oxidoreductase subunit 6 (subunit J)